MTTYDYVVATQLAALADGAAVSTANMGTLAGVALSIVTSGGGTATKVAATNSIRLKHGTSGVARMELALTTATAQMSILIKATLPTTNPAANSRITEVMDNNGTPAQRMRTEHLSSTGQLQLYNSANAGRFNTTPDISGDVYIAIGLETATATTGKYRFNVYDSTYTLIGSATYSHDDENVGLVAQLLKTLRVGRINSITDTGNLDIQYIRVSDSQVTPLSPIAAPPTIAVASGGPFFEYNAAIGSTPGGGGALTYSIAHTSGPDNSSGIREPVDGWFFIPQDTAAATYTITASEGGNTDSEVVDVPAISAGTPSGGVRRRRWNGAALV